MIIINRRIGDEVEQEKGEGFDSGLSTHPV